MPTAVEEFLRAYAPVTMARLVAEDFEFNGCPMKEGDWLLLPFPAANRDPDVFPDADKVIIDRQPNRHIAFGASEHRCLGSHLARAELRTAITEWHRLIPEYRIGADEPLMAHGGQIALLSLPLAWGA
jgi:cytochrome P450